MEQEPVMGSSNLATATWVTGLFAQRDLQMLQRKSLSAGNKTQEYMTVRFTTIPSK